MLPTIHIKDLCSVVISLMDSDSISYLLAVDSAPTGEEEGTPAQTLKAVITALSAELGVGEIVQLPNEEVRVVADVEFFQVSPRSCANCKLARQPRPHRRLCFGRTPSQPLALHLDMAVWGFEWGQCRGHSPPRTQAGCLRRQRHGV